MMTMVISGSDGVTFPDSTNQFSGGAFSFKNRIINGDMRIWQRGTSATISDNSNEGYNTVDRWAMQFGGGANGAVTWNQSTDIPDGQGFAYSLKVQCSTTGAATGTQEVRLYQAIEGFNVQDFAYGSSSPKTTTLSFWFKTNKVGIYSVYLQTSGSGTRRRYFTFTPAASDTWEKITIQISGDSVAIPNDNSAGFLVSIFLDNTPDYDSSASSTQWGTSLLFNNENNVNFLDSTNNILYITGVQLEVGSVATPFERRPYGTEFALCQRYCYQAIGRDVGSTNSDWAGGGYSVLTTLSLTPINVPVTMRSASGQSLVLSSSVGNYFALNGAGSSVTATAVVLDTPSVRCPVIGVTVASGLTVGQGSAFYVSSSANKAFITSEL